MQVNLNPESRVLRGNLIGHVTIICGMLVFVTNLFQTGEYILGQVAIFALLSFLSQLMPTRLPQGSDFSVAFILDLILITLYGTAPAVLVRAIVTFSARLCSKLLGRNDSLYRIIKTTGQAVLIVGMAGTVYQLIGHKILAFVIATVSYFFASTFFIALDGLLKTKEPFKASWGSVIRTLYINFFVLSSLTYLLTYLIKNAALEWKLFGVLLFFIPIMLVNHAFRLAVNIKQSYLNTVKTMVRAIEAKDPYTKGHSEHVAELVLSLGKEFGFSDKDLQKLEYIALLHDAGKIGIPEHILNKPSPLSTEEYEEVKKHVVLGAEILQKIKFLSSKSDVVLHHHERYDGSGYPSGLSGNNIPLESRILAAADAYDAMITERPFRPARTPVEAIEEMERLAGGQFDPKVVKVFKTVLKKRGEL